VNAAAERRADRAATARYEQLVELAPDGILVHADGVIVLANAAALHMAGATRREQLLGSPIEALLDPPYLKAAESLLADRLGPREPTQPVRDLLHRLDGTDCAVEIRAVAFMDRGVPSVHLILRDITERLAAEALARSIDERLQQAQRMETIGALAGGVAHEVNNMLQVILGFSDFLLADPLLAEGNRRDVHQVVNAAQRGAVVTGQLLAYGRRALHRPESVDLPTLIRDAEPMLRRGLTPTQELVIRGSAALPVNADPGQLKQVLINLVMNAGAAMPPRGRVTLTSAPARLARALPGVASTTIPPGSYAVVHVRDTGTGIPPDTLARIFEPFFTTKLPGKGTGLGLAAALGIVQQHGGYISVVTEPGLGTTFTVYLPASRTGTLTCGGPALVAAERGPAPGTATVLVVDDEAAIRSVTVRLLMAAGYQALAATDGIEALEIVARQGPPGMVLSDVVMPRMDGAELAERLWLRWPTLPVLFMSGYSAEALQPLMNLGAAGTLLQKPFSAEELLLRVAETLAQRAASPSSA
jgi:PAS domain S-box-containing protein